jgi:hypothetical protein
VLQQLKHLPEYQLKAVAASVEKVTIAYSCICSYALLFGMILLKLLAGCGNDLW